MAPVLNDIVQLVAVQTLNGVPINNVFHYRITELGSSVGYADMVTRFGTWWTTYVKPIVVSPLVLTGAIITNLTNGLDEHNGVLNVVGADTANTSTQFIAWGFRLNRTTKLTRHGQKRFAGVAEAAVNSGVHDPIYNAQLTALATALAAPLERQDGIESTDFALTPVIVGRNKITEPNPGQLNLARINLVSSAVFTGVTSQVSRKLSKIA